MKSHHKGHYKITNGSDTEPGGIRRGPRRKRTKKSLLRKIAERAARILANAALDAAKKAAREKKKPARLIAGRGHVRSHHKGQYHIVNGSKEEGHVRRGPRLKSSSSFAVRKRRARWRAAKQNERGK